MVSFSRAAFAAVSLISTVNAFAPSSSIGQRASFSRLYSDGPVDGKRIPSGKKEIGFDAASGRFFETGKSAEECVPDDEYCAIDNETGQLIRLTIAEKERMFLDCLQVSVSIVHCNFVHP
jgi:hypothetical protein